MIISADYQTHMDENLNNNPLCEAVHVELNRQYFIGAMTKVPVFQQGFWELPMIYQQTQLRQLTEVHVPVPQTWSLYNKMMSMILFGYVCRNPFSKEMRMLHANIADSMRRGKMYNLELSIGLALSTAPAALVHGESGSGKTTTMRQVFSMIPQAIEHSCYKGAHFKKKQLVWVSFDLPPNGSPKAMAASFFRAVDAALGTRYTEEWSDHSKLSVDKLFAAMQNVSATHYLGIVHIDELQFMLGYRKIKDSPSLQILETLFNKIGVPIIQSSTQQGVELFDTLKSNDHRLGHDMTTVRRMLNDREFKFSIHKLNSDYFTRLFDALFLPEIIHGQATQGISEFKAVFHKLTCGLPAIMTRLAHMHHETLHSLLQKPENSHRYPTTFDTKLLERVFKNQFHLIESALISLRNGHIGDFESKIRDNSDKVAVFSNDEVKKNTQKIHSKESAWPPVVKSADAPAQAIGNLSLDKEFKEFSAGFGSDDG